MASTGDDRTRNGGKLTPAQVRTIRERLAAGESQGSLARRYGVAVSTIGMIKRGRLWAGLDR